ncbi:CRISPR-associated protein Csm3 [Paenibacillus pabuli]|uniref:CRISPR-associated protein Csm3 n=1 Tax=Paenibacillus pabuli TaxID=1472 RepID=A0ABX9BEX4_9BACL|nr:RAMP superfamily CRISPR-associated protein [Paenibacillus pabuli]RAI89592.1 CRISPR-associated protein Csm3 [Paenibacillus pabuli]
MSDREISINVTTRSNLFIGGSPTTFEIGGVDLFTVTDSNGMPYIPASSLKGTLRQIVRDMFTQHSSSTLIAEAYRCYLEKLRDNNSIECKKYNIEQDRIDRMAKRYETVIQKASAEYLFGIEGFNDTPKLLFNDLILVDHKAALDHLFSIDSKNSIETTTEEGVPIVTANPRTYRTVRPGVSFEGDIQLYHVEKLSEMSIKSYIKQFIVDALDQFNSGIYRLGNSGSRGYGRVEVKCVWEGSLNG